jgi:hypothetical protein
LENKYFAGIIGNLGARYGKKEHTIQKSTANPADPDNHHGYHWGNDHPGDGPIFSGEVTTLTRGGEYPGVSLVYVNFSELSQPVIIK